MRNIADNKQVKESKDF